MAEEGAVASPLGENLVPQFVRDAAGSSTPGVTHAKLGMDCMIVVKVCDESDRRFDKKLQPEDIVKRVERARAQAAKSTPSLPLAGHAFIAARKLRCGDISLRAKTANGAEVLRQHCTSWVPMFGKLAYVRVPTWGIVIDGMPVKFADHLSEEFKRELIAGNTDRGNHETGKKAQLAATAVTTSSTNQPTTTAPIETESIEAAIPEAPTAPRTASKTISRELTKAIPFDPVPTKQPRGRPPKSKSSNNDDEEPISYEHIDTVLTASLLELTIVNPVELSNPGPSVSTAPTSYDNILLPPLPQMNMNIDNDNCIVLHSMPGFREIDSGELGSDARLEILSQFTKGHNYYPRDAPIEEEDEDTTI
ncbi:Hypothetical protein PENO1_109020 [Penicillium occitanis (nom. inval.)]|nr:Hypothetical protein PENO1_109020 [Penicillium occitanis (nom. inval.)]PCG88795.1 hypothetical protein PENOC_109380 [Penicillium occitanis (nom. inval.)]